MKKLVSLLAIALVSSLFAAGCGKLTNCSEAKVKADCDAGKFEAPFTCKWEEPAEGSKEQGKCVDTWAPKAEVTAACQLGTDQGKCDGEAAKAATKADAHSTCKWSKLEGADKETCNPAKLHAKK